MNKIIIMVITTMLLSSAVLAKSNSEPVSKQPTYQEALKNANKVCSVVPIEYLRQQCMAYMLSDYIKD